MYYLDDFLELLEPFSVQFREDLDRIGDLDNDVRHLQGELKSKSDDMFKDCEKKQKFGMSKDQIHADPAIVQQIKDIKKIHNKIKGSFKGVRPLNFFSRKKRPEIETNGRVGNESRSLSEAL